MGCRRMCYGYIKTHVPRVQGVGLSLCGSLQYEDGQMGLKVYQIALIGIAIGLTIGITVTLMAERCDYEAAMKPLVYVINELSGGR